MKTSFLAFAVGAVVLAGVFGSTAFNYATIGARTVTMNIVQDDGAVIAIDRLDTDYSCYVRFDGSTGKISVTFDGGSPACSSGGSGLNAGAIYYFHDIVKITNKGQKDWQRVWVNSTDALVTTNLTYHSDPTMTTGSTYAQADGFGSAVAIGHSLYVGLKIDGSTKDKTNNGWAANLSVHVRATA